VASYGPLFSDNGNRFSRSGGASDVYSGSTTVTYNADFANCGMGGYRRVVGSPLQLIASTTGGNNSPSSVATVDISVSLGTDIPFAGATGPFVSGILTPNPTVGDTLLIQNNSHDPDNNAGSSGRPGICCASWVVAKPKGSVVNGSSVASSSFAADIAGPYNGLLTVTDDEDVQAQILEPDLRHRS